MSLRELAGQTKKVFSTSQDGPVNISAPSGRAFRTWAIRQWLSRVAPLALLRSFDPSLGYGGSAATVLLAADSHESATIFAQYLTGTRGGDGVRNINHGVALVTHHALARMNQRIGLMGLAEIVDLLTPSITLLVAISLAIRHGRCSIRQITVPFADGTIRCDIDGDLHIIVKTYVSEPSSREEPLIKELQLLVGSFTAKRIEGFLWFPLLIEIFRTQKHPRLIAPLLEMAEVGVSFDRTFRRYDWLAEPYSKHPDPEGEVWELARKQSVE
jgi:hypothetical protein